MPDPPASTIYYTRPATQADAPALSRICLLTGDAGSSAEHLFSRPELIGLVYAEPYVFMSNTLGFVLCTSDQDGSGGERVVGYILCALDTQTYEAELREKWWPALRQQYPTSISEGTPDDIKYINMFARPPSTDPLLAEAYPAHMHIDLLPETQRKGWGRRMVALLVDEIQSRGGKKIHLGIDPRNETARQFYLKIGFKSLAEFDGCDFGLDIEEWKRESRENTCS